MVDFQCGDTFCVCGECSIEGSVVYASPEYLANHPDTIVDPYLSNLSVISA